MALKIYSKETEIRFSENTTHKGGELIGEGNGAKNGFCLGISVYHSESYGETGIHEDQEGFYVIEGTGMALVGSKEIRISPGISFIVYAGTPHAIKKDPDSTPVKLLWAHGAI